MRGDRGVGALAEQQLHQLDERGVDFGLLLERHVARLAIRALDQADARAQRVQPLDVASASVAEHDCSTMPTLR